MELVSIIVPIYNVDKYLRRCLESLVRQSYDEVEIILVNDGSTDNSLQIATEYAAMYDNVSVITQANQGLSGARNTGLKVANGEYILFVDSDDYMSTNAVEEMVTAIKNADIVEPCNVKIDENGNESPYEYHSPVDIGSYDLENNKKALLRAAMFVRGNMYRKAFLDGLEFPLGLVHEDIYYSTILFQKVKHIAYVENAKYYYFIRSDSIMNKGNDKMFDMFKVMKLLHTYFKEHQITNYEFLEKIYVRNFLIAVLFKKAKNIDSKYYAKRNEVCSEALKFLDQELSGYKHNPFITTKEQLAILVLRIPILRKLVWR